MKEVAKIVKGKKTQGFEVRDLREKFFMVDDVYLDEWAKVCGPYATLVYLTMCRHVSRDQTCFPSVVLMSEKLGVSARQVSRGIKTLEFHNIIKVSRDPGHKSLYWLLDKSQWKRQIIKWQGAGNCRPATKEEKKGVISA